MSKRTYYKGGRVDVWQGMENWCTQAIFNDNEILTKAGFDSRESAVAAAKAAIDKAVAYKEHIFKMF